MRNACNACETTASTECMMSLSTHIQEGIDFQQKEASFCYVTYTYVTSQ